MRRFLLLSFLLIELFVAAQTSWVEQYGTIGGYAGKESFQVLGQEEKMKNGKFSFTSFPQKSVLNDTFCLTEMNVNGFFKNGLMSGTWQMQKNQFLLKEELLKKPTEVKSSSKLFGYESTVKMGFEHGRLNGIVECQKRRLLNGKFGLKTKVSNAFLDQDTLKGEFFFQSKFQTLKGKTNENGFLEGWVELTYFSGGQKIQERRRYEDGFLLELEKTNMISQQVLIIMDFEDVKAQLKMLSDTSQDLKFTASKQFFGPKFNIGYPANDPKLNEQNDGVQLFEQFSFMIDSMRSMLNPSSENKIVLKLTKRFKYVYDSSEIELAAKLLGVCDTLESQVDQFLSKPTVKLRRNISDSINKKCVLLGHVIKKTAIVKEVLEKFESGFFDFRQREKFYEKGVFGLDAVDTLEFPLNNSKAKIPFEACPLISNPDSLMKKLEKYVFYLADLAEKNIQQVKATLVTYDNQEIIDSLEKILTFNEKKLADQYLASENLTQEEESKLSFSNKVYMSLNERLINPLKMKYINNSLSQVEIIAVVKNLNCYLKFLNQNQKNLDEIGVMKKTWNDSLFTVYRDNPFDFRMLESKILEGIQNASNLLLTSYANQLLNAKTCEQANAELAKIIKLNQRVKSLVKNHSNEKVQQLNKAIKRERVPVRIERYLEL